jgi:hypothetical protein
MLRGARIDEHQGSKLTKEQRVLLLLADGEWHSALQLALEVSHRFGGYLFTLKEAGVVWEKRHVTAPNGDSWWDYRLVPAARPEGQGVLL